MSYVCMISYNLQRRRGPRSYISRGQWIWMVHHATAPGTGRASQQIQKRFGRGTGFSASSRTGKESSRTEEVKSNISSSFAVAPVEFSNQVGPKSFVATTGASRTPQRVANAARCLRSTRSKQSLRLDGDAGCPAIGRTHLPWT